MHNIVLYTDEGLEVFGICTLGRFMASSASSLHSQQPLQLQKPVGDHSMAALESPSVSA